MTDRSAGAEPPRSWRRDGLLVALMLAGIAILASLGTWQVERLSWKAAIVERIDARISAPPVTAEAIARRVEAGEDVDYVPATAVGVFDHGAERYLLSTFDGQAGWNVVTPMRLQDGGALLFVNRGFVPYAMRDPRSRVDGNPAGDVAVSGLARAAEAGKPNPFTPDNDPAAGTFFWRSVADLSAGLALPPGTRVLPFTLDADRASSTAGGPVGGTTVIDIPNNHLQYAVTWFGLGAVLLVMLLGFVWRRAFARAGGGARGRAGG